MKALILCGGLGTRLWPISRKVKPKQFRVISGEQTLFDATYQRLRTILKAEDIFILTTREYADVIKEGRHDISEAQFILEPFSNGNAAAIGLAALKLFTRFPDETVLLCSSDAYIKQEDQFGVQVRRAGEIMNTDPKSAVLIGVFPPYPETGYGYIKLGKKLGEDYFQSGGFIEKPDLKTAEQFVVSSNYVWNIFLVVWKLDALIESYRKFWGPQMAVLEGIAHCAPASSVKERDEYARVHNTSIDYALLEKMDNLYVLPAHFTWFDVGHWKNVSRLAHEIKDTCVPQNHISINSNNIFTYSETGKLIATVGLENVAIVETPDALLVCAIDRSEDVRLLVKKMEDNGLEKYL